MANFLPEEAGRLRLCPICGTQSASRPFASSNIDTARLDAFAFASRKVPEYMRHRLLLCTRCDLVYASPAPDPEWLANAYDGAAYDSGPEARCAAATYAALVEPIAKGISRKGSALDIGAGDGAFLELLAALGFDNPVGVEPSAAPIAAASDSVRHRLRHALFNAKDFAPESFDLVTCFQTIEHVPDPLEMCKGAVSLLRPGGALVLVGHNRRALSAILLGKRSPIYDIEHLQLFSPRSARRLLEAAGLKRVETREVVNRYPLRYWMRLLPLPGGAKSRLLSALAGRGIGDLLIPLKAGNLAFFGWKE